MQMNRPVRTLGRRRPSAARLPKKPRDELILDALERLLAKAPLSKLDVEKIATEAGIGRLPEVRPRDALRETIERVTESWWPHRFVLREACDLWTVVPEVRDAWLKAIEVSTARLENAILRERELGVAPPGYNARRIAEALAWQNERLHFRAWAGLPGAMSKKQLCEIAMETYMRMIFLADDPDPEGAS